MKFTQYYLDCLSHASYLIGDETTGRAVVVDPQRDIAEYVDDAKAAGLTIELVLETHFHADFLSGHLELAAETGAKIGFSSVAETEFESRKLADGDPAVTVLLLPPDAHRTINVLQRAATVVLQKSLKEGFGLTVSEHTRARCPRK